MDTKLPIKTMMQFLKPIMATKRGVSNKPKRRKNSSRKKSATSVSTLRIIGTVVIVILFSLGLYALNQLESAQTKRTKQPITKTSVPVEDKSIANQESKANDYTFYKDLKDFEVIVNEDSAYSSSRSADENYVYLIQAGSFKTKPQAEKLLVELTLLGLEPTISSGKNASGNLWYRVRLGPFTSRGSMTAARSTIISNNLEAMVMKRKI